MTRRTLLSGAGALLPRIGRPAALLPLVQDGRSRYSIAVSATASPAERRGATELQNYLEAMTGARLPIITDTERRSGRLVLVGQSWALEQLKVRLPDRDLGPEDFALKTVGENLVIAGGGPRGAMYGVYTLLERLGCRWFTASVTRVPAVSKVELPHLDVIERPAFEYREPFFEEALDKNWAARNKTNGAHARLDESTGGKVQFYPWSHSFYKLIPPEQYFSTHPEYFSQIDGARKSVRAQLCLTNASVLRLVVARVFEWIRDHPDVGIFSVSQNDWEGWCECSNCRRVEEEEGGAHSGPLLRFVNSVAAQVEAKYPGKRITTLAYRYTEPPPLKTRPRKNVIIRLCPYGACEAHPYEKCKYDTYFIENLKGWSAKASGQLYIWHYCTNFSNFLLPFPNFDELAVDVPMYQRSGISGAFMQGAFAKGAANAELRSYVLAKQLWNPDVNVSQLVNEFMAGVYGNAAKPMRAYFDQLHEEVRRPPHGRGQHMWMRRSPHLSAQTLAKGKRLFQQAETVAGKKATFHRIQQARLPLEMAELLQLQTFSVRDGRYEPENLVELKPRFERFFDRLAGFGIDAIHEDSKIPADREELAKYMVSFPVATLEDATLRVNAVPDLGGRVIQLIDKASGMEVLRQPNPEDRHYPNTSGLLASLLPASRKRELPVQWELASNSSRSQIILTGVAANHVRLSRRLWLEEGVLHTETTAVNHAADPLPVVMEASADLNLGLSDDPYGAVSFRRLSDGRVDRTLIRPGLAPSSRADYVRSDRPDGAWSAQNRHDGIELTNLFRIEDVECCQVRWTMRGQNSLTLALFSPQRILQPGQSLILAADYKVRIGKISAQ